MNSERWLDLLPDDSVWGHGYGPGEHGIRLHYVRQGGGPVVLLLHGWPGFWYDWRRVIPEIAADADVIAPDFRGFGASDKPVWPPAEAYTPQIFAADILTLLDALDIKQFVVAAHDIGATVAQILARQAPERVRSLALFNPPYPGIGRRRFEPAVQREFWYQHFHNTPIADNLIGYDRDTIRLYLGYFYEHWAGRKAAIRPRELEAIVNAYSKPGAVLGSIAYYKARAGVREREADASPEGLRIMQPTVVLWGEADPVILAAWSDRIPEFFPESTLQLLPGVGHFVPVEAPEEAIEAIREAVRRAKV